MTMPESNLVPPLEGVEPGDALIIVPPFAAFDRPSLGAHLLQACARPEGHSVSVLYANLLLAHAIGEEAYKKISINYSCTEVLLGERFFARAAHDASPLGVPEDGSGDGKLLRALEDFGFSGTIEELRELEDVGTRWIRELGARVAEMGFRVVGASTTFEQTSSSLGLLRKIKREQPDVVTVLGGANCEGPMAEGILSVDCGVDYVFSGESEATFVEFLNDLEAGRLPEDRIVRGKIRRDMESLPRPVYREYFTQKEAFLPEEAIDDDSVWLPYESSRGCWWGEKSHCTFCGLNGLGMRFREKSADRVIEDLRALLEENPTRNVAFADNIMPHRYFKTLLPRLAEEVPEVRIFYEEKANLNLEKVLAMRDAGVRQFQPGIEALSSSLLKRMGKGVSAAQNVALLRYATSAELRVSWNLLYGFPQDLEEEYDHLPDLIPLMHHLPPPSSFGRLRVDRFSPYYERSDAYGVSNVRPWESYREIFPNTADLDKIAYYFQADYDSVYRSNAELLDGINRKIQEWRDVWEERSKQESTFFVKQASDDTFLIVDKRGLPGTEPVSFLDRERVAAVLSSCKLTGNCGPQREIVDWALERKLGAELEGRYVPLPTADPALLLVLENSYSQAS